MNRVSRRRFLQSLPMGAAVMGVPAGSAGERDSGISFGLITDLHYADKETSGTRFYRDSLPKLEAAMAWFEKQKVDFVVQLGDLIDRGEREHELAWIRTITGCFSGASMPWYTVLGNHDLATLNKAEFLGACSCAGRGAHYHFYDGEFLFVVLDANFTSDETPYAAGNFVWTDSWIPRAQQDWLEGVLAGYTGSKAVVLVHQNLDCEEDPHGVKNAPAIRAILERSGKVAAVLQGHRHSGGRADIRGIPYITLKAAVEGAFPASQACAVATMTPDGSGCVLDLWPAHGVLGDHR